MMTQHKDLASGRWGEMRFCEQMANIGSEIERAINWLEKKKPEYSEKAFFRGLELLELTIANVSQKKRIGELTRLKEVVLDFFIGDNNYQSSSVSLKKYFYYFNFEARRTT